jgi:hypothetical protein
MATQMVERITISRKPEDDANGDIIWGATEIAKVISRSERSTFYLLERGTLPARKVGRLWSASRATLLAYCAGEPANG